MSVRSKSVRSSPQRGLGHSAQGSVFPALPQPSKAAPGTSYLNFALLAFISGTITLELQGMDFGVNLGNILMVVGAGLALVFRLASPWRGGILWFRVTPQDYVLAATVLFYAATALYSAEPTETLVQAFYLMVAWLGASSLNSLPTKRIVRAYIQACVILTVLSFLMVAVSPSSAFQPHSTTGLPEMRGVFKHQLRLGLFMATGVAFMIIAWLNGEVKEIISRNPILSFSIFGVVGLCMVASLARSNIAFMLVALPISLGLSRRNFIRWFTVVIVILLITLIMFQSDTIQDSVSDETGRIALLSGRAMIWERTLQLAAEAPYLGHGYASFVSPQFDLIWREYRPPHAHNSLINAYFETGLVGVMLLLLLVIVQLVSSIRRVRTKRYSYTIFVVILAVLSSLTGVVYAGKMSVVYVILILMVGTETASSEAHGFERIDGDDIRSNAQEGLHWSETSPSEA